LVNKNISLTERAEFYHRTFPNYPKLFVDKGWLIGIWIIGNLYKSRSNLYGSYPYSYLKRIKSLFPDCSKILHLFSGSVSEDDTFDINPNFNPTFVGDAHELSSIVNKKYDLILADPPYSNEDAKHYGVPMINRNKVVKECVKILEKGGFLVWLDQVYPMYRKTELKLVGTIGVIQSTNHRVRVAFIFKKM